MALGPKPDIDGEITDTAPNRQARRKIADNLTKRGGVTAKLGFPILRRVKTISFLAKFIIAGSLFDPSIFAQQEQYLIHPDSKKQAGVPSGKVTQAEFTDSTVYPGTDRDYWIYVPAQYKPGQATSLMVFQDGKAYVNGATINALDNLIHQGDIPVMIGCRRDNGGIDFVHNLMMACKSARRELGGNSVSHLRDRVDHTHEFDFLDGT